MPQARYTSLQLARFTDLTRHAGIAEGHGVAAQALQCGCDSRAAGTDPMLLEGWVFALLGYHATEQEAHQALARRAAVVPWWDAAAETWGAVLAPFRTYGETNHLAPGGAAALFAECHAPPPAESPIVVLTTAGFDTGPGFDLQRALRFGADVSAVRASMTNTPGLRSQQTFFFPGVFTFDATTVTMWEAFEAMRQFAYGPGSHRHKLDRHRAEPGSDRTSFTRYAVLEECGTWYGRTMLAAAG